MATERPKESLGVAIPSHLPVIELATTPFLDESRSADSASEGGNEDAQFPNSGNNGEEIIIPDPPVANGAGWLPVSGSGENACIKFQLSPISLTLGRSSIGEVLERCLKEKDIIKIGRQVIRDGQATIRGNKKATEQDIWFTSKVSKLK